MEKTAKNTLGTVALVLSIIGILLSIIIIWLPLLVVSLILWIIALTKKPRGSAIASIIISLLPILFIAGLTVALWSPVVKPIMDFTDDWKSMVAENTWLKEAFEDTTFQKYYEYAITQEMSVIDWEALIDERDSVTNQIKLATTTALNIITEKTPLIYENWKNWASMPSLWDGAVNDFASSLANTSRKLLQYNGKDVTWEYVLDFTDTSISIKLCNNIGGNYTIEGETIKWNFFQNEMACIDDEKMVLENAFALSGASFGILSTRMEWEGNAQRLLITTINWDTFLFVKILDVNNRVDVIQDLNDKIESGVALTEDEVDALLNELQQLSAE